MSFSDKQKAVILKAIPYLERDMPETKGLTERVLEKNVDYIIASDFTGSVLEVCYGAMRASIADSAVTRLQRRNEAILTINQTLAKYL
jgi:hypothetical protein